MITTKQPTESTPPTPTSLLPAIIAASSGETTDGHSKTPKRSRQRRSYPFFKECPGCGESFAVANCDEFHKKQTCSPSCAVKVSADKRRGVKRGLQRNPHGPRERTKVLTLVCAVCGKSFQRPAAWAKKAVQHMCSTQCNGTVRALALRPFDGHSKGKLRPNTGLAGARNPAWKGGVTYFKTHGNYTGVKYVRCPMDFLNMARKDGYVMEHRLLVAQAMGRLLLRSEVVHHIDHDPTNNALLNLQLFASNRDHKLHEHHGLPLPIWP